MGNIIEKKTDSFSYTIAVKNGVFNLVGVIRATLGHSLWPTAPPGKSGLKLSEQDKAALIAFLKTL